MNRARKPSGQIHEAEFVRSFVAPQRQARFLELLSNPRRRSKFLSDLAHKAPFDPRWIISLPTSAQDPTALYKLLRSKGAPEECWVLTEAEGLDHSFQRLANILALTVGYDMATCISCLPGRLAYFENEDDRFVMERR